MTDTRTCPVCGNEISLTAARCPHCRTEASVRVGEKGPQHRTINLEKGMPLVQQAVERLRLELETSRRQGYRVVTLIHGYGSSGRGGAIKEEVHRQLRYLKHRQEINDMLPGEAFTTRTGRGRQLVHRFPFLSGHRDINRANPGVTLVVLS